MRVVICGGGLQGVELCFLAKEAGFYTVLIDKDMACPAKNLADSFVCFDFSTLAHKNDDYLTFLKICQQATLLIPATENEKALSLLTQFCQENTLVFAFDAHAYAISSSKLASRDFFLGCQSPIAKPITCVEDMVFPFIAKPSEGSGSQGVQVFHDEQSFFQAFPKGFESPRWLFEAYHNGPSYSVEVCGKEGQYKAHTVTALDMDENFDCSGVRTPSNLSPQEELAIQSEAIKLAQTIKLVGLMDLEVIKTENDFIILEIDARFPSQTPTAVYYASGVNLVEELVACFVPYTPKSSGQSMRHVHYTHHLFDANGWHNLGEHIMREHGPLRKETAAPFPLLVGMVAKSTVITHLFYDNERCSSTSLTNYHNHLNNVKQTFNRCDAL